MKYVFSYSFNQAGKTQILNTLDALERQLHMTIQLTPAERSALNTIADGRAPFVRKAYNYVKDKPSLYLADMPAQDFFDDFETHDFLDFVGKRLLNIFEKASDTALLAGAEAYDQANFFYRTVQLRALNGTPGMDSIASDLGKLFSGGGRPRSQDNEPTDTDDNGNANENPDTNTPDDDDKS